MFLIENFIIWKILYFLMSIFFFALSLSTTIPFNPQPDYQPMSHQQSHGGAYQTPQQGGYQGQQQPGYQGQQQPGYPGSHPSGSQGQQGSSAGPYSVEGMRVDLRDMTAQRDSALTELRERDARIQRLLGELQGLVSKVDVIR